MELTMRSVFRRAILGLTCVMVMGLTVVMTGQEALGQSSVVIDDWTHHHLIFSNPGTAADAIENGRYEHWYNVTHDPRYQLQQLKRSHPQPAVAPAAAPAPSRLPAPATRSATAGHAARPVVSPSQ